MRQSFLRTGCLGLAMIGLTAGTTFADTPSASAAQQPASPAATQTPAPAEVDNGARIQMEPTEFDFGTLWQGEPAEKEFKIKNVGTGDLTISVKSSCGCTVPSKPKSPLKPGEETSFQISYNTKKRKGQANQTVTVQTNDPNQKSIQIRVHGEVKELVKMEPPDGIFFGQLYENSKTSKSVKLMPQTEQEMRLKLKNGQDFGMYDLELKELTPGKVYELVATSKPPLEVNSPKSRSEVVLETGLERMPEMNVVVQSVVVPPVQVRPTRLYVPRTLSTKLTRNIRLSYLPEQPLKITEVKATSEALKVEVSPETPMQAGANTAWREVVVTIESMAELPDDGAEVIIKTDSKDPRYSELHVPVKVVANNPGTQPGATGLAPVSNSFGEQRAIDQAKGKQPSPN